MVLLVHFTYIDPVIFDKKVIQVDSKGGVYLRGKVRELKEGEWEGLVGIRNELEDQDNRTRNIVWTTDVKAVVGGVGGLPLTFEAPDENIKGLIADALKTSYGIKILS